jgi:hypothetical protein
MSRIGHIAALLADGILVNGKDLAAIPQTFATVMAVKAQIFDSTKPKNCPTDFSFPQTYKIQVSPDLNVAPSIRDHNEWMKLNKRPPLNL